MRSIYRERKTRHIELTDEMLAKDDAQSERDLAGGADKGVSGRIRLLFSQGVEPREIANQLGVEFYRVRRVLEATRKLRSDACRPEDAGIGEYVPLSSVRRALSITHPISYQTLHRWLDEGGVRKLRIGKRIQVHKGDLDRWIERNTEVRTRVEFARDMRR